MAISRNSLKPRARFWQRLMRAYRGHLQSQVAPKSFLEEQSETGTRRRHSETVPVARITRRWPWICFQRQAQFESKSGFLCAAAGRQRRGLLLGAPCFFEIELGVGGGKKFFDALAVAVADGDR